MVKLYLPSLGASALRHYEIMQSSFLLNSLIPNVIEGGESAPLSSFYKKKKSKIGKTYHNSIFKPMVGITITSYYLRMQVGSLMLFKENHAIWNYPLVVHKGEGFHSFHMSLGLGSLTCFLMSKEDKLLAK